MLNFIEDIAKEAGKFLLNNFGSLNESDILNKEGLHNYVTKIDKECEKIILNRIEKAYPEHSIYGEEYGQQDKGSDYTWFIDPLDGTTNYIHCHPFFCVSIALSYKGEIIAGVINAPYLGEVFKAEKGQGAYLNNNKISVSKCDKLEEALLSTGFACLRKNPNSPNPAIFHKILKLTSDIRREGSAALNLAYVAAGRNDGFWEFGLEAFDVAAGTIICKEAGAIVTDIMKNDDYIFGKNIIATCKGIYDSLIQQLQIGKD
ncbi:MAG: inositol monophosphatase family protein [Pseudomonadota bacterium]